MYTSRYNKEVCNSAGLKGLKLQILDYIVEWIQGGHAKFSIVNDKQMFWINVQHMVNELGICYSTAVKSLRFLENINLIKKYHKFLHNDENKISNKLYISLNYSEYKKYINFNEYNKYRCKWIDNKIKEENMIFPEFEIPQNEADKNSDAIARNIILKYSCYFKHRLPTEGSEPTKLYKQICKVIKDIYSGNFCNPRLYRFGSDFYKNKTFKVDDWQDKVKAVAGDWNKVADLIFNALKNFELMHNKNRLPYNKKYLQKNLSLWFYDIFTNEGEGQSQFIQCLNEPDFIASHNSELKADKIYENLPNAVKVGGNKLFSLNKTMYAGVFWENIQSLYEWSRSAFFHEKGMMYWLGEPENIVNKFYDYCEDKEISISTATVDIVKAVESSGPLVWFIKDACNQYEMNIELADCSSPAEIEVLYNELEKEQSVCF